MWSSWSLGRYVEYLIRFIVSRAHLGQLISNLAKVGSFTVYWVIHDCKTITTEKDRIMEVLAKVEMVRVFEG